MARDMVFQSYNQRLFSVNELIVLLEENSARNSEFDHDHFELACMDNPKANFILKNMICRC